MIQSRKTIVGLMALLFVALLGYGYFVSSTVKNFEFLLMCSQGKEVLIPKSACQAYLLKFGGSPDEIQQLNRGIGVGWALAAESQEDKVKLLEFLLNKGIAIDALDERSGVSALHASMLHNDIYATELLLKYGANPSVKDQTRGETPLELALKLAVKPNQPDRTAIIRLLEKHNN